MPSFNQFDIFINLQSSPLWVFSSSPGSMQVRAYSFWNQASLIKLKRFWTNYFLLELEWRGFISILARIEEKADQNTENSDVEIESRSVLYINIFSYWLLSWFE